jgi:sarcosine oxidase
VQRQHVGYFELDTPVAETQPGRFPVWVYLGSSASGLYYGLPEFGRPGIKAALHGVGPASDDPDEHPGADPAAIGRVRAWLTEQLAVRVRATLHSETCLYTNTPDEHFIMGALPGCPRVVVGSVCSGHGFKFGPLTGRLLAELVMSGKTSVPEFEDARSTFAPPGE